MHDGSGRIVVSGLTKSFGAIQAVRNLSFTVEPGSVTGFLGPNGAGKTTTLRMLLGLVRPTSGLATINGLPHDKLQTPALVVGSVLDNDGFHPARTARNHLRVYAAAIGLPDTRCDEVLALVGLTEAAGRRVGGFSLGMRQRLALATALLGDPQVLVLDEPANGLDPEGIRWLRGFLRNYAAQGRSVLISSHLLAEVEQTIDQVVIISQGQTRYYGRIDQLQASQKPRVLVQAADLNALAGALKKAGLEQLESLPDGRLAVYSADVRQIGDVAAQAGVAVYGMEQEKPDLEKLFFELTTPQYMGAPGYGAQQGYAGQPMHAVEGQNPYQRPPNPPPGNQGPPGPPGPPGQHGGWGGR